MVTIMELSEHYRGKTLEIIAGPYKGELFTIEDYYTITRGMKWLEGLRDNQVICLEYAVMIALENLPREDEPLQGRVCGTRSLRHTSQLMEPLTLIKEKQLLTKENKDAKINEIRKCDPSKGITPTEGTSIRPKSGR